MSQAQSVRRRVADFTHDIHEKLHAHARIGLLTRADITAAQYRSVLRGYHEIYGSAENRRLERGYWPNLSLGSSCAALGQDLGESCPPKAAFFDWAASPEAMLGVLYTLHGARFGAAVIAQKLARHLPREPRAFFDQAMAVGTWRSLVAQMEVTGAEEVACRQMCLAAERTFEIVDQIA